MSSLLMKTADKRNFLIHEKMLPSVVEFVKTFKAEVYRVEILKGKMIAQLKTLAEALCNPQYQPEMKCRTIERIYPPVKTIPSAKIREFIQQEFLNGKIVSLDRLKIRYKNYHISDSCLCNYLSAVRKQLVKNGQNIVKTGRGKYCIQQNSF